MSKKRIAVIGSGTAGAASALYLHRQGHEVTVFEREALPKPFGAGIMLQSTGLHCLAEFGLAEKTILRGTKLHGMVGKDIYGKKVVDLSFDNNNGLFGLGVHRSSLYFLLFDQLSKEGIEVLLGKEIVEIQGTEKSTLIDKNGNQYPSYDLVIVANGSRSKLRDKYAPIKSRKPQHYGALWAKVLYDNDAFNSQIIQYYEGSHTMLGFMPIGKPDATSGEYINFFWSLREDEFNNWRSNSIEQWKEKIYRLKPDYIPLIDKITHHDQLTFGPYTDVELKQSYINNIVFVGDAAHPMSPQLSQGTSFAMLDAKFLRESLQLFPENLKKALHHFHKNRYTQVYYYQHLSRFITPLFQSDAKSTIFRDTLFKFICSNPPSRKILLGTILGYRKNLWSNLDKWYYLG